LQEYVSRECDKFADFDLQWHKQESGVSDDTSQSKSSVSASVPAQKTTFHPLREYPLIVQAEASLQCLDFAGLFLSQLVSVFRLTPKVRWMPRMLERSWV